MLQKLTFPTRIQAESSISFHRMFPVQEYHQIELIVTRQVNARDNPCDHNLTRRPVSEVVSLARPIGTSSGDDGGVGVVVGVVISMLLRQLLGLLLSLDHGTTSAPGQIVQLVLPGISLLSGHNGVDREGLLVQGETGGLFIVTQPSDTADGAELRVVAATVTYNGAEERA